MNKNLKYTFILFIVLSVVVIAWNTLANFFGGVGLNFACLLVVLSLIIMLLFTDQYVKNRTKDMFWISVGFTALEFLNYFIFEFNIGSFDVWRAFVVIQNIYAIIGILFLAYIVFRLISEIKQVKFGIVEAMLGNGKSGKKIKKDKQVSNGSLEEKPNKQSSNQTSNQNNSAEFVDNNEEN